MQHYRKVITPEEFQNLRRRSFKGWEDREVFRTTFVNPPTALTKGTLDGFYKFPTNKVTLLTLFTFNKCGDSYTGIHGNFLLRVLPGYTDATISDLYALLKALFHCSPSVFEILDGVSSEKYVLIEIQEMYIHKNYDFECIVFLQKLYFSLTRKIVKIVNEKNIKVNIDLKLYDNEEFSRLGFKNPTITKFGNINLVLKYEGENFENIANICMKELVVDYFEKTDCKVLHNFYSCCEYFRNYIQKNHVLGNPIHAIYFELGKIITNFPPLLLKKHFDILVMLCNILGKICSSKNFDGLRKGKFRTCAQINHDLYCHKRIACRNVISPLYLCGESCFINWDLLRNDTASDSEYLVNSSGVFQKFIDEVYPSSNNCDFFLLVTCFLASVMAARKVRIRYDEHDYGNFSPLIFTNVNMASIKNIFDDFFEIIRDIDSDILLEKITHCTIKKRIKSKSHFLIFDDLENNRNNTCKLFTKYGGSYKKNMDEIVRIAPLEDSKMSIANTCAFFDPEKTKTLFTSSHFINSGYFKKCIFINLENFNDGDCNIKKSELNLFFSKINSFLDRGGDTISIPKRYTKEINGIISIAKKYPDIQAFRAKKFLLNIYFNVFLSLIMVKSYYSDNFVSTIQYDDIKETRDIFNIITERMAKTLTNDENNKVNILKRKLIEYIKINNINYITKRDIYRYTGLSANDQKVGLIIDALSSYGILTKFTLRVDNFRGRPLETLYRVRRSYWAS